MKQRWREILLAFLMAVTLWYSVSGSEKLESQIDVRVDYRGLPQGLVIRSGLINKVTVRVQAPGAMLRTLSARDFTFYMDLSRVRKGRNMLPINLADLPFHSGIDVLDATPSRITLDVDTLESKEVPLVAEISGLPPGDLAAEVSFMPPAITITGASELLAPIDKLSVPVLIEEPIVPGTSVTQRLLNLPEGVDYQPTEVKIATRIDFKRKQVKVSRSVQVDVPSSLGKFVRPDKVDISLAIPESLADKAASNKEIKAFVRLEQYDLGSYTLPVRVSLPNGAELVGVDPPQVSVTLEQKQPGADKK